jgi:hypothetical protein
VGFERCAMGSDRREDGREEGDGVIYRWMEMETEW